jgi:hypothetical protein
VHWWSEEEKEYLRQHYPTHTQQQLLDMFNEHFNVAIGLKQLTGALKRYDIKSGRTGRFEKDQTAWNKGMKGLQQGGKETQFKKGNRPLNFRPVGSERISKDGYIEIKVADPRTWRLKHAVLWEEVYGKVPKGHCIIFLDGNKQNLDIENLQLITRGQLARMNQNHLISDNAELTKTGLIIANIYGKIGERKKVKR